MDCTRHISLLCGLVLLLGGMPGCKKPAEADKPPAAPEPVPAADEEPPEDDFSYEQPEPDEVQVERDEASYRAGHVCDVQLVRLFADGFKRLKARERVMAYHLARAALAGRDITFDQVHRSGLDVRCLVESILENTLDSDPKTESKLREYLLRLGIHSGFYDRSTGIKFVPDLPCERFQAAAHAANAAGAKMGLERGESLEERLARLKPIIFDADHQPRLVPETSQVKRDILSASALNLYRGVTMRSLRSFEENYSRNSRLIRVDGRLVEEIYRSGDKRRTIPPGRYASELRRVNRRLYGVLAWAGKTQRAILADLIEYFRTGNPRTFDSVSREWYKRPFRLEFMIGFNDLSLDPRHAKGLFEGLVGYANEPVSAQLASLVRHLEYFEGQLPWPKEQRRNWGAPPLAVAVDLLVATGGAGPMCNEAFSLAPDRDAGQERAQKVLVLSNVIEARTRAVSLPLAREFVPAAVREKVCEHLPSVALVRVALRDLFGRYSGRTDPRAKKSLRNVMPVMEEIKAELVSWYLLADPKLTELGMLPGRDASRAAWDFLAAEAVVEEVLSSSDSLRPRDIARRVIIRYLMEKAGAVRLVEQDGKTVVVVPDHAVLRQAIEKLLKRSQKILSAAERSSGLRLIQRYGSHASWPEMEGIAGRAGELGLRRLIAYVMPKIRPHRGVSGRYEDASISHSEELGRQFLRYSRY
ncbi:MAG: hypothetical protein JXR96_05030 [Deltaproteobacteria bacterium]|nr:hypothetical protein [Deltaproteobacteria bacterium]